MSHWHNTQSRLIKIINSVCIRILCIYIYLCAYFMRLYVLIARDSLYIERTAKRARNIKLSAFRRVQNWNCRISYTHKSNRRRIITFVWQFVFPSSFFCYIANMQIAINCYANSITCLKLAFCAYLLRFFCFVSF